MDVRKDQETLESLKREANELRQNVWVWKGISLVLLLLYVFEVGGILHLGGQ